MAEKEKVKKSKEKLTDKEKLEFASLKLESSMKVMEEGHKLIEEQKEYIDLLLRQRQAYMTAIISCMVMGIIFLLL